MGDKVTIKSNEELKAAKNEVPTLETGKETASADEKVSFWKNPFKWTKKFNEDHPKVKWIVAGVLAGPFLVGGARVLKVMLENRKGEDEETEYLEEGTDQDETVEDEET